MSTILITGANRGIGLEMCRQSEARGDAVNAVCRKRPSELEALDVEIVEPVDVLRLADLKVLRNALDRK